VSARRLALVAGGGILALVAIAVLVVDLATAPRPGARPPPEPSPAAALPPSAAPAEAAPWPPAAVAPASSPASAPAAAAPIASGEPPPRILMRPLAPVARSLTPLIAPCVPGDLRAHDAPRRGPGGRGAPADAPAALLVELAVVDGGLEVVDASVASYGDLSREQLQCAQRAVQGRRIRAPTGFQLEPGQRMRMRLALP